MTMESDPPPIQRKSTPTDITTSLAVRRARRRAAGRSGGVFQISPGAPWNIEYASESFIHDLDNNNGLENDKENVHTHFTDAIKPNNSIIPNKDEYLQQSKTRTYVAPRLDLDINVNAANGNFSSSTSSTLLSALPTPLHLRKSSGTSTTPSSSSRRASRRVSKVLATKTTPTDSESSVPAATNTTTVTNTHPQLQSIVSSPAPTARLQTSSSLSPSKSSLRGGMTHLKSRIRHTLHHFGRRKAKEPASLILNTNYVEKVTENGSGNERAHGLEIPIPITNAHVVQDRNAAQTQLTTKMQLNDKNSAYVVEDQTPESESEQDQQLKPEYLDSFDFKSKSTPEVISNGGRSDEDNNEEETIAPTSIKAYHSFPNFESFTPQNHNDNDDNDSHDNDDPNDDDDNDTITILAPMPQHPKTTLAIQALTHNLSEYTLHDSNTATAATTAADVDVDRENEHAFFTVGSQQRTTYQENRHVGDGGDRKTALIMADHADDDAESTVFL